MVEKKEEKRFMIMEKEVIEKMKEEKKEEIEMKEEQEIIERKRKRQKRWLKEEKEVQPIKENAKETTGNRREELTRQDERGRGGEGSWMYLKLKSYVYRSFCYIWGYN